jgi:uncharacterized protein (DUF1015 family)
MRRSHVATILPFRGLLYSSSRVPDLKQVIAPPYDVIDSELSARLRSADEHNIVHIDLPEGEAPAKYSRAASLLATWTDEGVLERESQPALYVVSQRYSVRGMPEKVRWGFIALMRIEDDEAGVVLPHEKTLDAPRNDRIELITSTRSQTSPIFVLYSDPSGGVSSMVESVSHRPADRWISDNGGVDTRLWRVTDPDVLTRVSEGLASNRIWIADGHHRYAAARSVRDRLRAAESATPPGSRSYDYLMAYMSNIDAEGLSILPYHRVARGDFPDATSLARMVEGHFETKCFSFEGFGHRAEQIRRGLHEVTGRGHTAIGIYSGGPEFSLFILKSVEDTSDLLSSIPGPLRGLDVSILHTVILEAGLGITQERQKAGGILRYTHEVERAIDWVDSGEAKLAFVLNPPDRRVMMTVAAAGLQMPQKSTFFYPKVPTGLVLHHFDPVDEVLGRPTGGDA